MSENEAESEKLRVEIAELYSRIEKLEAQQSVISNQNAAARFGVAKATSSASILTAVNRVGAFTLLLGIIFFFKYAVDENLINASAGSFLGLLLGVLLLASGEWLQRKSLHVAAQGLVGCGVATGLITLYAASAYYHLLSPAVAFCALVATCLVGVLLSFRYRSSAIAGVGFVGAFWTPALLHSGEASDSVAPLLLYFVLIASAMLPVAARLQSTVLPPVLAAIALLCASFAFPYPHAGSMLSFALLLAAGDFIAAARTKHISGTQAGFLVAGHLGVVVAGFYSLRLLISTPSAQSELSSILLAGYGVLLLSLGFLRTYAAVNKPLGSAFLILVVSKLYLFDIWNLPRVLRVSAFVGLGALLLVASYLFSRSDRDRSQA